MPRSASSRHHRRGSLVLYHGTSSHRAGSIKRTGLSAPGGTNPLRYTLTTDKPTAKAYANWATLQEKRRGSKERVLTVEIPDDKVDEYLYPPGEHIITTTMDDPVPKRHTVYAIRKKLPPGWVR